MSSYFFRRWRVFAVLLGLVACGQSLGAAPEISNVFPDFPGVSPHILTGENFDPKTTEVWVWDPPTSDEIVKGSVPAWGAAPPAIPAAPPKGAGRVKPLDVEPQVIVAALRGCVVWVKNGRQVSAPYLLNVPRPFWISDEKAEAGSLVHMFGFGLRVLRRPCRIALRSADKLIFAAPIVEALSPRHADTRLVYFEIPRDAAPGNYAVYVHNSFGGALGWAKAGMLAVTAPGKDAEKVFNVRDHGAKGDGIANDYPAVRKAMGLAAKAGGRGVVFFPPGTYRTDETIRVPAGVRLRGASRANTAIRGAGYDPSDDRVTYAAWFTKVRGIPTAVVRLTDDTGLESLTIEGATSKGEGGVAIVEAVPREIRFPDGGEVRNVTIADCRIRADETDLKTRRWCYTQALYVGPSSRNVRILRNDVFGSAANLGLGTTRGGAVRMEIIDNKFHGLGTDIVILGGQGYDCLIDGNLFVDTPGRFVFNPRRWCYFRYNEVHQLFRGSWANSSETYLLHGTIDQNRTKVVGTATGATANTLTDEKQEFKPGLYKDSAVLITAGRGFGQYRLVSGNTADTVTVQRPWRVTPDATSEYVLGPMFVENALLANLNNTCGRLTLWLDCIANVVEMHRDAFSGGTDLTSGPLYYNMLLDGWCDGAGITINDGGGYRGPFVFGNYVVRNRIRSPHLQKVGHARAPVARGGVVLGGRSPDPRRTRRARAGSSHTIIADNFFSFTNVGVRIGPQARKAFVLNNTFQKVDQPVIDSGAQTIGGGNKTVSIDEKGSHTTGLPDIAGPREPDADDRRAHRPYRKGYPPLFHTVLQLKAFVSGQTVLGCGQPYTIFRGAASDAAQQQCRRNLEKLYAMIKEYHAQRGHLPKAALFPSRPLHDPDSIAVILGDKARPLLICPTCGTDFRRLGLNYVWNEKLSGRKLSEIQDPGKTWLMMDFVAVHEWMVRNGVCGHRGAVNVLYADGTVKCTWPFAYDERENVWRREGKSVDPWLRWARSE